MNKVNKGLYLCEFSNGTLKVGRGIKTRDRIQHHRATAACFGIELKRTVEFAFHNPQRAEALLISWCRDRAVTVSSKEWFQGIDFDSCVEFVNQLLLADFGPPQEKTTTVATDLMMDKFHSLFATKTAAAYIGGRRKISTLPGVETMLPILDQLHHRCEAIRAGVASGATAPQWYERLNCFNDWEVDLFFFDKASPDFALFEDIEYAIEGMQ